MLFAEVVKWFGSCLNVGGGKGLIEAPLTKLIGIAAVGIQFEPRLLVPDMRLTRKQLLRTGGPHNVSTCSLGRTTSGQLNFANE
jgi:hypothetical protein|eukprot:1017898-Prymnesium_polylepis.1